MINEMGEELRINENPIISNSVLFNANYHKAACCNQALSIKYFRTSTKMKYFATCHLHKEYIFIF